MAGSKSVTDAISSLRKSLLLADEDHRPWYSMLEQHGKARDYCFKQDLAKKWRAKPGVIKSWTLGGWDKYGYPVFSAFLGGAWNKELYYDKEGEYVGTEYDCVEYPLSTFRLTGDDYVITVPDMRLCLRNGVRRRMQRAIDMLEGKPGGIG